MNLSLKAILFMIVSAFIGMIVIGIKIFGLEQFAVGFLIFLVIWFVVFSFVNINIY